MKYVPQNSLTIQAFDNNQISAQMDTICAVILDSVVLCPEDDKIDYKEIASTMYDCLLKGEGNSINLKHDTRGLGIIFDALQDTKRKEDRTKRNIITVQPINDSQLEIRYNISGSLYHCTFNVNFLYDKEKFTNKFIKAIREVGKECQKYFLKENANLLKKDNPNIRGRDVATDTADLNSDSPASLKQPAPAPKQLIPDISIFTRPDQSPEDEKRLQEKLVSKTQSNIVAHGITSRLQSLCNNAVQTFTKGKGKGKSRNKGKGKGKN